MEDKEITFGVYIPSYGRYEQGMITGKCFENPKHVVRKSQAELYRRNGFKNVIGVEDSEVDDYGKVFNWIVDNAKEDVVAIVDDDIKGFMYRMDFSEDIKDVDTVQMEFERLAQMICDLDIGLAFGTATAVPYDYTSEFGWMGIPGAFKVVNRKCIKARVDYTLPRNQDIDYVLQELLHNRICLNAKYLVDKEYKDSKTNTSGSLYSGNDIKASVDIMTARWGKYFEYDDKKNVPKIRVKR